MPGTPTRSSSPITSPTRLRIARRKPRASHIYFVVRDDANDPDRNVRQATVHLFADMGVQPAMLASDFVRAEASDDRELPVSRIDEPRTGSSLPPGPVQISGAPHDRGGGCVAAVEVSVDGGATWHPAEGREAWRYQWMPEGSGTRTILCRAVDDSGNLEAPTVGVTVTVSEEA